MRFNLRREWTGLPAAVGLGGLIIFLRCRQALSYPLFSDDYAFYEYTRRRGLLDVLLHPHRLGGYCRPFSRDLHFWLASHAFGLNPVPYHWVNLALVLGILALLYAVVSRAMAPGAGLWTVVLCSLSPIHFVLIAWAGCSQDLWCAAACLASILLYLRGQPWASALLFGVALLSKEIAVALPLALLALTWAGRIASSPLLPETKISWCGVGGYGRPPTSGRISL